MALKGKYLQKPDVTSYPVFAAGIFEGTENEGAAAVVLHMVGQVLPGNVGRAALVWALDRKARAVVLMVLQRTDSNSGKNTAGVQINGCMGKKKSLKVPPRLPKKNTCGFKNEATEIEDIEFFMLKPQKKKKKKLPASEVKQFFLILLYSFRSMSQ